MKEKKMKVIAIEGLDGTGKASTSKALVEKLKAMGYKVEHASFPRYNTIFGAAIRCMLDGEFGPMPEFDPDLCAANYTLDRVSFFEKMLPKFDADGVDFLVLDRSFYSNFMYQASKLKSVSSLINWVIRNYHNEFVVSGLSQYALVTFVLSLNETDRQAQIKTRRALDTIEADLDHLKGVSDFIDWCFSNKYEIAKEYDDVLVSKPTQNDYNMSNFQRDSEMFHQAYAAYHANVIKVETKHVKDHSKLPAEMLRVSEVICGLMGIDTDKSDIPNKASIEVDQKAVINMKLAQLEDLFKGMIREIASNAFPDERKDMVVPSPKDVRALFDNLSISFYLDDDSDVIAEKYCLKIQGGDSARVIYGPMQLTDTILTKITFHGVKPFIFNTVMAYIVISILRASLEIFKEKCLKDVEECFK